MITEELQEQQAELLFYVNDHLNTPQQLVDRAGVVRWSAVYTPFGEARVNPDSTVTQNLRFAGQYYDAETGCHYNWNRYYCPAIGRYTTSDPIGLAGGLNTYLYANANPVMYTDPQGLFVCGGFCIGGAVVGSVAVVNWTRNYWNEPVSDIIDVRNWTEMASDKSIYHQMGPGNENNRKFVSPDGHSEAVFDSCDKLVTDPVNQGTYNFFGPDNAIMHGITDVLPYFIFGMSPLDMFNPQRFTTTYDHLTR